MTPSLPTLKRLSLEQKPDLPESDTTLACFNLLVLTGQLALNDTVGCTKGVSNLLVGVVIIKKVIAFALFAHVTKLVRARCGDFLHQFPLAVFEAFKRHGLPVIEFGEQVNIVEFDVFG